MELDIYKVDRQTEAFLKKIREHKEILAENKEHLFSFYQYLTATGCKKKRQLKYLTMLYMVARWVNRDFKAMTRPDMQALIAAINSKPYSAWSRHDLKVAIKVLFRWLYTGEKNSKRATTPDIVSWIEIDRVQSKHMLPDDLLDESDIKKLIESSLNPRDKALIGTLYEAGIRAGELLSLRIKSVSFDERGVVLLVTGKTGDRRVRIVVYAQLLQSWLSMHPYKDDREAPVWVGVAMKKKPMNYTVLRSMLQKVARRAGISKRINPHSFRHSRASHMASFLTEAQLKEYMGWQQSSEMARVYVHLSGRDVDNAILAMNGLTADTKPRKLTVPIRCHVCSTFNDAETERCEKCRSPLTQDAVNSDLTAQTQRSQLTQISELILHYLYLSLSEEHREAITRGLREKGLDGMWQKIVTAEANPSA